MRVSDWLKMIWPWPLSVQLESQLFGREQFPSGKWYQKCHTKTIYSEKYSKFNLKKIQLKLCSTTTWILTTGFWNLKKNVALVKFLLIFSLKFYSRKTNFNWDNIDKNSHITFWCHFQCSRSIWLLHCRRLSNVTTASAVTDLYDAPRVLKSLSYKYFKIIIFTIEKTHCMINVFYSRWFF